MKRILIIGFLLITTTYSLLAISFPHNTVPLNNPVYTLLENLELRNLIVDSGDVKPYSRIFIVKQLREAETSERITSAEKQIIGAVLDSFEIVEENSRDDMLLRGSVMSPSLLSEDGKLEIGIRQRSFVSIPVSNVLALDSRNEISGYMRGDLSEYSSLQIEMGARYDLLNPEAWYPYDFHTPGEGQYIIYSEDGNIDSRGQGDFAFNFLLAPEVTVSLLDDHLSLRWGMFKRDWGVGDGNLNISGNARSFDAIEGRIQFTHWLTYHFLTGTLTAPKILARFGGYGRPDQYQNMLTTKRLEFALPFDVQVSLFETVMWPKRLELGYLNPFMVTTIYQNTLGDYDNMFAGFDFSWGVTEITELYGAFMVDETQSLNPISWFSDPRSIFGSQIGVKQHVPILSFTTAALQYTRLEPFFYTHKPIGHPSYPYVEGSDETKQDLSYTNKLENLGYYLPPNSDEIKLIIDSFPAQRLHNRLQLSYIRHSDQYGDSIDDYMDYALEESGGYADKAFSAHIVEHTFISSLQVDWNIEEAPISVYGSYSYYATFKKEESTDTGWGFKQDHLVSVGVSLFSQ